jgi:hypothetical protein
MTYCNRERDERRAAPSRPVMAMCRPVDPVGIAVPSGDRSPYPASEGLT